MIQICKLNIHNWFCASSYALKSSHDSGKVVSMLALYSNDPNSNPAEVNSFHVKFVLEKIKMNKDV